MAPKNITVILPIPYRGGSLRVAKTIARMIKKGSTEAGDECRVRLAVIQEKYDLYSDFRDLIEDGIQVREFEWRAVPRSAVENMALLQNVTVELDLDEYQVPEDGFNNFIDSDLWFVVSDRLERPLAPLKRYIVFATDYIQRYVPEIFHESERGRFDLPFLQTTRLATGVVTTTPQTRMDAISYVGIPASRVHLAPMDFDPTAFPATAAGGLLEDHFVWPTNTTEHKNHIRAFEALRLYYEKLGGKLKVKMVGPNSININPEVTPAPHLAGIEYIQRMRREVKNSTTLRENIEFCGELSDDEYARTVASAQFLWHPVIYDNGTFAVAEAALLGCPSLSSGYPQMRYIGERFSIPMEFFNARSSQDMAEALKKMEERASDLRSQLPSREALSRHSWEHYANEYWAMLTQIAAQKPQSSGV